MQHAITLGTVSCNARDPGNGTTIPAQNDVLRINTRLVEVDVVVRSKDGPVTGLAKEDFTLFDNGKAQRVDVFSVSTAERSKVNDAQPALPEGVVSNRVRDRSCEARPSFCLTG